MRPLHALFALAVALLGVRMAIGCAYYEDRADRALQTFAAIDERTIHGDTQFTPIERSAAEAACVAWTGFTRGRVRLHIAWDLDDSNYMDLPPPVLYRVGKSEATGNYAGRGDAQHIWWVPETCTDLQACVQHEIGHMLGLQHVPMRGQVMSAINPSRVFGTADNQECLRVGVCRSSGPDVTTVTVQVDPAIPRVEPEYPAAP